MAILLGFLKRGFHFGVCTNSWSARSMRWTASRVQGVWVYFSGNDNDNIEDYITNESEKGKALVDRMTVCTWARTCGSCGFSGFLWFSVVFCGIQWLRRCGCSGCSTSHSRVRLIDTLIVVVRCHGATARHHHVVGIDIRIEGIAATPDNHVIRVLFHFIIHWRLRRWRRRRRGRSVIGDQIPLNLHVARQDQLG